MWTDYERDAAFWITAPLSGGELVKVAESIQQSESISGFYSHYVIVHYGDGSQEDIVTALDTGKAIISDLDKFGVSYTVKPSGMGSAELPNNPISQTEAEEAEIK